MIVKNTISSRYALQVFCVKASSGNWDEIKYEICQSNVIQRDSALFARKLERALEKYALEREEEVGSCGLYNLNILTSFNIGLGGFK